MAVVIITKIGRAAYAFCINSPLLCKINICDCDNLRIFEIMTDKIPVYLNVFKRVTRLSEYVAGGHRVRKNVVKSRKTDICALFVLLWRDSGAKTRFLILFNLTIEKICEIRYNIP